MTCEDARRDYITSLNAHVEAVSKLARHGEEVSRRSRLLCETGSQWGSRT